MFLDSKSDYVFVRAIKRKSEAVECLKEFCQQIGKPREIMSDWAKEFTLGAWLRFCLDSGIRMKHSQPYTAASNGRVERMNRTLKEMSRCMLLDGGCKPELWAHAIDTAAYLHNRSTSSRNPDTTPCEVFLFCFVLFIKLPMSFQRAQEASPPGESFDVLGSMSRT